MSSLPLHPLHPFSLLEHLVRVVLPAKCRSENSKTYYQAQLDKPDETIEACKGKLASWVLKLWDEGKLYKLERYFVFGH
jgi:hypothetical protein